MAQWYIEAKPGESWRQASRSFVDWVRLRIELQSFGFSEGDALLHNGSSFHCFCVPDHHGENVELFEAWAVADARAHGRAEGHTLPLSTGEVVALPVLPAASTPPWLK